MIIRLILHISILLIPIGVYSIDLNGNWKGYIVNQGLTINQSNPILLELKITDNVVNGTMRDEVYNSDQFVIKVINGSQEGNELSIKQVAISKKPSVNTTRWCRMNLDLKYNDSTGYLEGSFKSYDCRNTQGKLLLYRTEDVMNIESDLSQSHFWFDQLKKDLAKGLNAPEVRAIERENFKFQPIYFEFDKAEIKPQFYSFLNRLIKVLEGHSDLRVKVTGHTDFVGSNAYNDVLSQQRAQAIIDYFVSKGLSKDRLVFDFKGENQPADTNETAEGRQHNRRVDFAFI